MNYDFLIIGGGSAGYAAARTAVAQGLHTAVVDGAEELGGLCILRGCMPSKTLLASSRVYHTMARAEEFGLRAGALEARGGEIAARKRRIIAGFADYRREQLEHGKFDLLRGTARFTDAHTVEVAMREGGPRTITARSFLLATGSVPNDAPLGAICEAGCWTTDDVLSSETLPESIIILGGGATAAEFATYYAQLGRRTIVVQRSPRLLRGTDDDIGDVLAAGLRKRGVELYTDTKLLSAERTANGKRVIFSHQGREVAVEAERLLNALGRSPAVKGLELKAAGVAMDGGRPVTQGTQQTSRPHIFAAGDVAGPFEIVHIAIQQGEVAARNAARLLADQGAALEETDYRLKLYAIFSDPEVAVCGASEHELKEHGLPCRVAKYPFDDHGKSIAIGETEGFVKLIAGETGEILGGAVIGPHAADLIHEIVVAMRFRATAAQLASVPHYHPTLSEIWTYPAEELM